MASHATVDPLFTKRLLELTSQAKANANAIITGNASSPTIPKEPVAPLNISGLTALFDRTAIGAEYQAVVAGSASTGSAGDAISLTIQSDYLAVAERAYRAQHATPIRLMGMSAGRLRGHGDDAGIFAGGVLSYVQDLIKQGQLT